MFTSIFIALIVLVLTTAFLSKLFKLPKNIWLLFMAQPLAASASPVIVFIGGIVSTQLSSDPSLATLPVTLMILGVASASIPAALTAKKKGRRFAAIFGFTITFVAALVATWSMIQASFGYFLVASILFGISTAFIHQLRFAAIESATNEDDIPKVLSILMLSGLFAAFLGPEIAVAAKDLIASPHGFAGSFFLLGLMAIFAMLIMVKFQEPETSGSENNGVARPLSEIVKQPIFVIAILSAAIGYALMSYLMTATPLSMHHFSGHSLESTKWVIQSHIAAMFLPSLFTGYIVKKFGIKALLLSGTIIYSVVAIIALSGQEVLHYWWALLLLGVGWNFLFLTGTTLLPQSYESHERHKVQALNDFVLFGFQAVASLMAGWMLFKAGWQNVVYSSMPFIAALFVVSFYFLKVQRKQEI